MVAPTTSEIAVLAPARRGGPARDGLEVDPPARPEDDWLWALRRQYAEALIDRVRFGRDGWPSEAYLDRIERVLDRMEAML